MYYLILLFLITHLHAAKIAVISLAVGEKYQKAVLPGYLNKQRYCKEHGYDLFYVTERLDNSRSIHWSKILLVNQILTKYEWVFWTDADSLIMNPSIALEELIDNRYFLIICKQSDKITANSGQFLIRNTQLSFDFLSEVYQPQYSNLDFYDQGAVNKVLEFDRYKKNTLFLHQRAMNSIWGKLWGEPSADVHFHDGDFILHFMGVNVDDLANHMKYWADYLKAHEAHIRSIRSDHLHRTIAFNLKD